MFSQRCFLHPFVAAHLLLAATLLVAGCSSEDPVGENVATANIANNAGVVGEPSANQYPQPTALPTAIGVSNGGDFRLETTGGGTFNEEAVFGTDEDSAVTADNYPEVVFKTQFGDITVQLNRDKAPQTVDNFLNNYAKTGFYDGTILHTVKRGEMIAGGGYAADYQAKRAGAEILNEADNGLKNEVGTIAMARYPDVIDSATSQFWFNLDHNYWLDHTSTESAQTFGYCVFGKVIEGMDVLQQIANVQVTDQESIPSTPVTPVVIESVRHRQPLGPTP